MAEFENKVVIITGASSGVGHSAAVLFAKRGAKVAIVARSKDKLDEVEKQCIAVSKPENVLVIVADVSKMEDLQRIVDETVKRFGQIDVLVNNAGAADMETISSVTLENYEYMMNLNARAPLFLTKYCIPYLEKTKGNIVNVSTVGSLRGYPTSVVYTMAKAAMDQLTRTTVAELSPKGIRANTVNPGLISSNFGSAAGFQQHAYDAFTAATVAKTPVRRTANPEDIAECILFLASDKASFVDGVNLLADGGIVAVA